VKGHRLEDLFSRLNVWKRGSSRAPHKPLLLLWAIARYSQGLDRLIAFSEIEEPLTRLLREFGPPRKSYHPEYPFWRLQNDGIWEIPGADRFTSRASNTDAKKTELIQKEAQGGLKPEIYKCVQSDPHFVCEVVSGLLEAHFPPSMHDEILSAVGLQGFHLYRKQPRDHRFRERILRAYGYKCMFCGFDVRMDQMNVGLEAAHIRWHQAGGPDIEPNGIALCVLHHKLFDLGAFTLDRESGRILVSERVHGTVGVAEWALRYHGSEPHSPIRDDFRPRGDFLDWHHKEVFRSPARQL